MIQRRFSVVFSGTQSRCFRVFTVHILQDFFFPSSVHSMYAIIRYIMEHCAKQALDLNRCFIVETLGFFNLSLFEWCYTEGFQL